MRYGFVSYVVILSFAVYSLTGCGSTRSAASGAAASNLTIATTSMPSGTAGSAYSFTLTAEGGVPPYSWSVSSGALPAGLQLNATTGLVAGSPSAASRETISFGVQDGAEHFATAKFTLFIAAGTSTTSTLTVTTTTLRTATVGAGYNFALDAQGGTPPYTWSLVSGALPLGLLLDPPSGIITGTPTEAADPALKLQVRDSAGAVASQSFSLLVVSASAFGSGNSYYVDSAGGDDSNNGTSASSPWRTIAKVNARNFSPGDHILFKRGDTWREPLAISSSGDADNPIVIDAYGNGAAPIVAGTDLVPQSAWTLCSSCRKNVWKAKVPTQPKLVTFDGTNGDAQTSISSLSASGDWYWTSNELYVYAAMNPGSAYLRPGVEVGDRKLVVDLSGLAYVTLQNLHLGGGNGIPTNGVIYAHEQSGNPPHDLLLNNLVLANGAGHGLHLEDCNNCVIRGLSVSGMASDGISLVSLDPNHPITSGSIVGNTVTTSHHDGIATYGCAIGGNCQGVALPKGVFLSGIIISGNTVHDNGEGIYLEWTNHSSVFSNTLYHNTDRTNPAAEGGGIELEASSNNVVQKNLIYANRGNGMELSNDAGAASALSGSSNNTVQFNAIHDNGSHGLFTNDAPTQNNRFLYNLVWNQVNGECFLANGVGHVFVGNVCWHNSTAIDLYTSSSTTTTSNITIKNNILAGNITRAVHVESGVSSSSLVFDYNDYDFGSGAAFMLFDTADNLAGWQLAGFDKHSFVADPKFVSAAPAAPSDFVLEPSSPDLGTGGALGLPMATGLAPGSTWPSGVTTATQPSSWDIGAFIGP